MLSVSIPLYQCPTETVSTNAVITGEEASARLIRKRERHKSQDLRISQALTRPFARQSEGIGTTLIFRAYCIHYGVRLGDMRDAPFAVWNESGASSNMLLTEVTATEKMSDAGKQRGGLPRREVKRASEGECQTPMENRNPILIFQWPCEDYIYMDRR